MNLQLRQPSHLATECVLEILCCNEQCWVEECVCVCSGRGRRGGSMVSSYTLKSGGSGKEALTLCGLRASLTTHQHLIG